MLSHSGRLGLALRYRLHDLLLRWHSALCLQLLELLWRHLVNDLLRLQLCCGLTDGLLHRLHWLDLDRSGDRLSLGCRSHEFHRHWSSCDGDRGLGDGQWLHILHGWYLPCGFWYLIIHQLGSEHRVQ